MPVVEPSPRPDADMPQYGGTVGFAAGNVAFCNACGWRGVATFSGGTPKRELGRVYRRGEWVPLRRRQARVWSYGHALTHCPSCQREPTPLAPGRRTRGSSKPKRKAARAARRRNR